MDVERRTQEIGRDLFRRVREVHVPFSFNRWLDEQFMRLSLRDEHRKTQLFRFVDVFPALTTPDQILRHLHEYLGLAWPGGKLLAAFTRTNVTRMARGFVAASDLPELTAVIARLQGQHLDYTLDVLGEAVLTETEADQYQQLYLALLAGLPPGSNVSLKLSSLDSQFDPLDPAGTSARVRRRLLPILNRARQQRAFVNIDMEQHAYKNLTLQIFREVSAETAGNHLGLALQAYLPETATDLATLAEAGLEATIRLVKGAYWDYETVLAAQNNWPPPVYLHKAATDANFERLTTFLFEHHQQLRPAIATHNIRSLAHALAEAERRAVPPDAFEFQLLYGMADPIKAALVEMGYRVRVYTPFGELLPGMAYLVRRLLENTSNTSFLRQGFLDHESEEQLLMNPLKMQPPTGRASRGSAGAAFRNEPVADFSHPEVRTAVQAALDSFQPGTHPLVIAGNRIKTNSHIVSINPSHPNEIVGHCACATVDHARQAIGAAAQAFPAWRDTPAIDRAALLRRVAGILRRRRPELAAIEIRECAKPWREADADVCEAIDFCEFYAAEMLRLSAPRQRDVPGETNAYFYEPRGVAVIIAPWNFPLAILTGMAAAAVVTGNTAILKPAEPAPVIAAQLMEAFAAAGTPPGVVNYLPGPGHEIGPVLVEHPDVALIAFTGSLEVGLSIKRQTAETFKQVICETGGKNAIIIDDDADLDDAIKAVVHSAFGYAGQKCSACSRVIVLAAIYDSFLARLIDATRSLNVGPAEDPGNFLGPVIDAKAQTRIRKMIAGFQPVFVGAQPPEGFYVAPHIFADVPSMAPLAQEEIFGPVLVVLKASDLADALQIANGVKYALTGGFFSRSPAHIAQVRREFRVGNLYINRKITGALVDRQPFGGFKMSGGGTKAGGPDYLQQFMVPRTVTENTLRHGFAPRSD